MANQASRQSRNSFYPQLCKEDKNTDTETKEDAQYWAKNSTKDMSNEILVFNEVLITILEAQIISN